jgi:hypothetical protein
VEIIVDSVENPRKTMSTRLYCIECGSEIDRIPGGRVSIPSLCQECGDRLRRDLDPAKSQPKKNPIRQEGLRLWKCEAVA